MTLIEVRQLCVDNFPSSKTRESIMNGLESVVQKLVEARICGDLWVDGSFVTGKINPNDVDVLLHIKPDFYDTVAHDQKQIIQWVNTDLKGDYLCDSYVMYEYPKGDPQESDYEWLRAYWIKQYGWSRGEEMKGIVLVSLPNGT